MLVDRFLFSISFLWPFALVLLPVLGYLLYQMNKGAKSVDSLHQGKEGEISVASSLDSLKAYGAQIIYDIQAPGFNVDMAVVSEKGIFAIEVKNPTIYSDDEHIRYDGREVYIGDRRQYKNPVKQVIDAAVWLHEELTKRTKRRGFFVKPVVLFPSPWQVEPMDAETKRHVWILNANAFLSFVSNEAKHLSGSDVDVFAEAIRGLRGSQV